MTGNHVALGDSAIRGARVTFTELRSADDPMLRAWLRFRESIATSLARATASTALAGAAAVQHRSSSQERATSAIAPERTPALWRLLATNNRELGRSYVLYSTFAAAREHVVRLQEESADLEIAIVNGPLNASRGWVILHDGAPVMTCGRWYSSASTGIAAGAGALVAISRAALSAEADRSAPSGRFSHRSPG